jgi:serine/threonine protein kinase
MTRLRGLYSDNLIEVVQWCMSLDPLSRPQSVFALQKELNREEEPTFTPPGLVDKLRMGLGGMLGSKAATVIETTERSSFQDL